MVGHISDAQDFADEDWDDCAKGAGNHFEQFALTAGSQPKGITYNSVDDKIWFTLADFEDANEVPVGGAGWINFNTPPTIKECLLPVDEGEGGQTDCANPSSSLLGGGGDLLEAADELSPALDKGAEEECQTITHTLSGTLSGTIPDPDTGEPLDLTGKFVLNSDVACEDEGKGEDAITSVEISDPVLSFTPDELGTFTRDGSDVATAGLHGVCHVTNMYFMCSVTVSGGWAPVDDETPNDVELAEVGSATLAIVAE
jgi:hypothetical protein